MIGEGETLVCLGFPLVLYQKLESYDQILIADVSSFKEPNTISFTFCSLPFFTPIS